jgi:hypothetical protein
MEAAANKKFADELEQQRNGEKSTSEVGTGPSKAKAVSDREWMNRIQSADSIIGFMQERGYRQ